MEDRPLVRKGMGPEPSPPSLWFPHLHMGVVGGTEHAATLAAHAVTRIVGRRVATGQVATGIEFTGQPR